MTDDAATAHLLLVEDEDHLSAGIKLNLELEGYRVDIARTAREAGELLLRPEGFDAIILDVMLPDKSGFELCRRLRDSGNFTPVLMLTARNKVEDRVTGIEAGADDYLTKPFELAELMARVHSLLRRRDWERSQTEPLSSGGVLNFGTAQIDFDAHTASRDGKELHLTKLELDLLRYFAENPGRVCSRQELQENVWNLANYPSTRMVDNFIMRLRRHFEHKPGSPKFFVSVRGAGYKFVPEP